MIRFALALVILAAPAEASGISRDAVGALVDEMTAAFASNDAALIAAFVERRFAADAEIVERVRGGLDDAPPREETLTSARDEIGRRWALQTQRQRGVEFRAQIRALSPDGTAQLVAEELATVEMPGVDAPGRRARAARSIAIRTERSCTVRLAPAGDSVVFTRYMCDVTLQAQ